MPIALPRCPSFLVLVARACAWSGIGVLVGAQSAPAPAPAPAHAQEDPLPAPDPAVTRAELEHHVRFLASDELAGRAPCEPGNQRAALYLARALAAAGLQPAGELEGSERGWFQRLPLHRLDYPAAPRLLCTMESGEVVEARYGVDFDLRIRGRARSTEPLRIRFFYDFNYERLPVPGLPDQAIYFGAGGLTRKDLFARRGITGLEDWGLELDIEAGERGYEPGKPKDPPASKLVSAEAEGPDGCELVTLRGELRRPFEEQKLVGVQLLVEERDSQVPASNVVGRIPGVGTPERPELAQEVLVFSAHFDHLGTRAPRSEDESRDLIFNGADDDASGCAALLELAQAFAAGPPPARTLIFLFTNGEESGGSGSRRYLSDPAEPLERTVADLNLEMLGRPDELAGGPGGLWLTGWERSNLGPAWAEAGLDIVEDPRPDQRFFMRSDNFAFAQRGVVAQSLSSFNLHKEYHRTSDEADTLDYEHLTAATRVALAAGRLLAEGRLDPAWVEGGQPRPRGERPSTPPENRLRQGAREGRERSHKEQDDEKDGQEDSGGGDGALRQGD